MTAHDFIIKRGDTSPSFRSRCLNAEAPVDLSSANQVRLVMAQNGAIAAALPMTIENQTTNPGWVNHVWQASETSVAGVYKAEVEVTWSDGTVQTFPADGYATIYIAPDLR